MVTSVPPVYALEAGDAAEAQPRNTITREEFDLPELEADHRIAETGEDAEVGEIYELRTANEKHFLTNTGSIIAHVFPTDIHFQNEDGEYEEIDNTLVRDGDVYTNKNNPFSVELARNPNSDDDLLRVEYDGHSLSLSMEGINRRARTNIIDNSFVTANPLFTIEDLRPRTEPDSIIFQPAPVTPLIINDEDDDVVADNVVSGIKYAGIMPGTDLQYDIIGKKVKESIIVHNKQSIKEEYTFNINPEGLNVVLNDDNSLYLKDEEDEIIFVIERPFMFDDGALSYDVDLVLERQDDGTYEYTLKPCMEWLKNSDRIFPITIDPTIRTNNTTAGIRDVFIFEGDNTTTGNNWAHLRAGNSRTATSNSRPTRSLIRFELPTLNPGDQVINATMSLLGFDYDLHSHAVSPGSQTVTVDVHQVLTSWTESNATWARLGASQHFSGRVADYMQFRHDPRNQMIRYDTNITRLVRDWYNGTANHGVMLKSRLEAVGNRQNGDAFFFSSRSVHASRRPVISIEFRNQLGLEDHQTYSTLSMGNVDVHINNFNGNLVATHYNFSTPGNRMPVSFSSVYNTGYVGPEENRTYGIGWRNNLHQTLVTRTIGGREFIRFRDDTGTQHHFIREGAEWVPVDEGLGLTITGNGSPNFIMTAEDGTRMTFSLGTTVWFVTKIEDGHGNAINVERDPTNYHRVLSATDAVGDTLYFEYNDRNLLSKVTDVAGREITYEYDDVGRLVRITYPDGTSIRFQYTVNHRLTRVTAEDGAHLTIAYFNTTPHRVQSIREFASDGTAGGSLTFAYAGTSTDITDAEGRTMRYAFNHRGHTVSVFGLGLSNGVRNAWATSTVHGTSGASNNKLLSEGVLVRSTDNFFANSGAYGTGTATPEWTSTRRNRVGATVNASATAVDTHSYFGNRSFRMHTQTRNDYVSFWQRVPLRAGETYTLSFYAKGRLGERYAPSRSFEAVYEYRRGTAASSAIVTRRSTPFEITNEWQRFSYTFTISDNMITPISNPLVGLRLDYLEGEVFVDGLQLEVGEIANPYNLVSNGNFDNGERGWIRNANLTTEDHVVRESTFSYFRLFSSPSMSKYFRQFIDASGSRGETINLSFHARNAGVELAEAVPLGNGVAASPAKQARVSVHLRDRNGNRVQTERINVPADTGIWQFFQEDIAADVDFHSVELVGAFNNNRGTIHYTNFNLTKGAGGTKFEYDNQGRIIRVTDATGEVIEIEHEDNEETEEEPANDCESNNRLIRSVSGRITTYNKCDEFGNFIGTRIQDDNGNYIETNKEYDDTGQFIIRESDERGNETIFERDRYRNLLISTTNANDVTITNEHDIMDRIISTTKAGKTNRYTHTNGRISRINHNNMNYNFIHDDFGNLTSVRIGNNPLITNTFAPRTGNILTTTFGNGQTVRFTHDRLDRITSIVNSSGTTRLWYDNRGNIARMVTPHQNLNFIYDNSGRIITHNEDDRFKIHYAYDNNGNVSKRYQLDDNEHLHRFSNENSEDDGSLIRAIINNISFNYSYDALGRTTSRTLKVGNREFKIEYSYVGVSGNRTTNLVRSITHGDNTITYEYDNLGNITKIKYNDVVVSEFEFDDKNQLIKEIRGDYEIIYEYDGHGNILKRIITNTETEETETIIYEYNNSSWTDQLTSFNGKEITYDAIGNPLTFGDYISFGWKNGRQLESFIDTNRDLVISYKYNNDGSRISKIVNGVETRYFLDGDNIIFSETEGRVIRFTYDSVGNLVSLNYNGNYYFYIFNIKGDVIGLLDGNLNKVVRYEYDAWGVHLAILDGEGNDISEDLTHIANINPFRYRSYYFDQETGLYYLQTRYYNPEIGRFINADGLVDTGTGILGHNMFAYTDNNPVMGYDPDGKWTRANHRRITRAAVGETLIGSVLRRYSYPNTAANRRIALDMLVLGSQWPDVLRLDGAIGRVLSAPNGWHGLRRQANLTARRNMEDNVNRVISRTVNDGHRFLNKPNSNSNLRQGFKHLGMGLHTIQDSTAHFTIQRDGDHLRRMDWLTWDFTTNSLGVITSWRIIVPTVNGNRRARLARDLSRQHIQQIANHMNRNPTQLTWRNIVDRLR